MKNGSSDKFLSTMMMICYNLTTQTKTWSQGVEKAWMGLNFEGCFKGLWLKISSGCRWKRRFQVGVDLIKNW